MKFLFWSSVSAVLEVDCFHILTAGNFWVICYQIWPKYHIVTSLLPHILFYKAVLMVWCEVKRNPVLLKQHRINPYVVVLWKESACIVYSVRTNSTPQGKKPYEMMRYHMACWFPQRMMPYKDSMLVSVISRLDPVAVVSVLISARRSLCCQSHL